jgi:hypothetical protein
MPATALSGENTHHLDTTITTGKNVQSSIPPGILKVIDSEIAADNSTEYPVENKIKIRQKKLTAHHLIPDITPAVRPKPGPAFQAGGIDRHSAGTIRSVLHGSCLYHGRIPVNKEVIREFSRQSVGIDDHDIP